MIMLTLETEAFYYVILIHLSNSDYVLNSWSIGKVKEAMLMFFIMPWIWSQMI